MNVARRLLADESGVAVIEYALLAAVIAVAITASVSVFGTTLLGIYKTACSAVSNGMGGGDCS
jgi:pilus assembly protein Flp/PilA